MRNGSRARHDLPVLLERDRELSALRALVEAAARGDAGLAVVEGPAGIGNPHHAFMLMTTNGEVCLHLTEPRAEREPVWAVDRGEEETCHARWPAIRRHHRGGEAEHGPSRRQRSMSMAQPSPSGRWRVSRHP
jgi:hypothetical protein